jgi:hypothetical protein
MPISVLCPSCDAPVNAPDSAAGKRAKCPKCQEVMILPGGAAEEFEVVDEPAPKKKPRVVVEEDEDEDRPRKKSKARREEEDDEEERPAKKSSRRVVAAEEDEDDEDDERPKKKSRRKDGDDDDRPTKKGKSKKKAGPSMGLLIGGGVALLLLVAGGLYFAFKGGSGSQAKSGGGAAAAPKGINWVAFDAPDGSFTSAFPEGAPNPVTLEEIAKQSSRANADPKDIAQAKDQMKAVGLTIEAWSREYQGRKYTVMVMSFPSLPPAAAAMLNPEAVAQRNAQNGANTLSDTPFSAGGIQGKQLLTHDAARNRWTFGRIGMAGQGRLVMLAAESDKELKADDADAKTFFEKFQWKK